MEFFGVAWEAWEEGKELGVTGVALKQRIIWRLTDAQRSQASPLRLLGADIERLEKFGKGFLGVTGGGSVLKALQSWAIEEWPELSPVWIGDVPLTEVWDLTKAKRRTIWYLMDLAARNLTKEAISSEIQLRVGKMIVLNTVRRMRYRLKKYGYQNILRERWGTGSGR